MMATQQIETHLYLFNGELSYLCIADKDDFYTLALIKRQNVMIFLRAKSVCLYIDFGNFLALMVKMLIASGSEYCDSWSK